MEQEEQYFKGQQQEQRASQVGHALADERRAHAHLMARSASDVDARAQRLCCSA
jgi:hypothetical protein